LLVELGGEPAQVLGARVLHAIDARAEAHDAGLVRDGLLDPRLRLRRVLDLVDHQHHLLIGAAVQRPLEGADGRGDRRVHVREGGGGDACRERRGVELVIGVQDQRDVEGLHGEGAGLPAEHHVEEVGRQVQLGIRRDGDLAAAQTLPGGDQRGHLRGEPDRLTNLGLARLVVVVGIERGERGHAGAKHLHRRRLLRQRAQQRDELGRQPARRRRIQRLVEGVVLLLRRQRAEPEEVDDLLERGLGGEVVHVVAAVDQAAFAAVDEADVRRRDDDILEAGFVDGAHGALSPRGVRSKRVVCIMEGRALQPTGMRIIDFYDRHPISEGQVLDAVRRARGSADALTADDLYPFDQDHYGGLGAVDALARRGLVAGGRLAFSDWIAHPGLGDVERARLEDWMAAVTLQSLDGYRALLGRVGFRGVEAEDLTDEWRAILRERLTMYRALREDTVRRLGEARYREYDALYAFFVGLVEAGKLGGGRFSGTREREEPLISARFETNGPEHDRALASDVATFREQQGLPFPDEPRCLSRIDGKWPPDGHRFLVGHELQHPAAIVQGNRRRLFEHHRAMGGRIDAPGRGQVQGADAVRRPI